MAYPRIGASFPLATVIRCETGTFKYVAPDCMNVRSFIIVMGHPVSTMNLVDIEFIRHTPLIPPYDWASHTWCIGTVDCWTATVELVDVCGHCRVQKP